MPLPDPRCHQTPQPPDRFDDPYVPATDYSPPWMPKGWLGRETETALLPRLYSFKLSLVFGTISLQQTSVLQMTRMIVALGKGRQMLSSQYRPSSPSTSCCPTLCLDPSVHPVGGLGHVEAPARRRLIPSSASNSGYSL